MKIKSISIQPERILNDIQKAKPQGIVINSYEMDLDRGDVDIFGVSPDRASLITFQKNLESNGDIASIEIPISSFEAEANLEFLLSFKYVPISSTVSDTLR